MVTQTFMRPLAIVIGLVILFAGYTMITTAINQWTLLTYDVGVVDGSRVDRVVVKGHHETADDAWFDDALVKGPASLTFGTNNAATADVHVPAGWYELTQDGENCQIGSLRGEAFAADNAAQDVPATDVFSQNGVALKTTRAEGASSATDQQQTVHLAGCIWTEASGIWSAGGFQQLIRLIGQGAGLGPPIGALVALAALGSAFTGRMGQSPLLGVIILIVTFLLAGSLIDTLTPFVGNAFEAASPERYRMYGSGLGLLAKIVGNFYGVVIFSGLLYIGWMVITQFRSVSGGGAGVFGGAGGGMHRM